MSAFTKKINKLSDIQKAVAQPLPGERIEEFDPDLIDFEPQIRSRDNPGFTTESLSELGDDILANQQHTPAVIRDNPRAPGRLLMVAGERRCRACKMKGLKLKAIKRKLTDAEARRIQRSENIQRENLTQLETAMALREDKKRLKTLEKVAAEWNKGLNWVAEQLKYLEAVESDGPASAAVMDGVTADVTAVNDLRRLEKIDPSAAKEVLDEVKADPKANVRKAVRDKLQCTKADSDKNSRTREKSAGKKKEEQLGLTLPKQIKLSRKGSAVLAEALQKAEFLCEQIATFAELLHKQNEVREALGNSMQSVVHAQTELYRTRHALTQLSDTK